MTHVTAVSFWASQSLVAFLQSQTMSVATLNSSHLSSMHNTAQHSIAQHNQTPLPAPVGDDLASAVPKYDRERLPDAHGLVDIESSFSKLVGNKLAAALDPKFLKLVIHVVFGESDGRLKHGAFVLAALHCSSHHPGHMPLFWSHGTVFVTWRSRGHMAHMSHGTIPVS